MAYKDEHASLLELAQKLVLAIEGFEQQIDWGEVHHAHVSDYCDRGVRLASHVRSVLGLNAAEKYADACVLIRTCLEHQAISELTMLGDRYMQELGPLDDEEVRLLAARIESGEIPDVTDPPIQKRKGVSIVRRGLLASNDDVPDPESYPVPLSYFDLQAYDPLTAHPDRSEALIHGSPRFVDDDRFEKGNRERFRRSIGWSALCASLLMNDRYDEHQLVRLRQHYAFLSGFAHGTELEKKAYPQPGIMPTTSTYQHAFSELILLYCIWIAVDQIESMIEMIKRSPVPRLTGTQVLFDLTDLAKELAVHMWWPRQEPYEFDFIAEANQRHFDESARSIAEGIDLPAPTDPSEISASEVRYYRDPLARIERMHDPQVEMTTGLVFIPPWVSETGSV